MLANEVQHGNLFVNIKKIGIEPLVFDSVGVERLESADLGDDAAGSDDLFGFDVLHDEHIALAAGSVGDVFHAALGFEDSLAEQVTVAGESGEPYAGLVSERKELIEISDANGAYDDSRFGHGNSHFGTMTGWGQFFGGMPVRLFGPAI